MKTTFTTIAITLLSLVAFGQNQEKEWLTYLQSALFKTHKETAAAFELDIRQNNIEVVKKNLRKDKSWKRDNKAFLKQLEKSKDYFPLCNPIDTTISNGIDFSDLKTTTISFSYSCKQKRKDSFEYKIDFIFYWQDNTTKNFEIEFSEQIDRKKIQKLINDIPLPMPSKN